MVDPAAVLDALPVALYLTDAQGRITYYNEAAVELWGHRPQLGSLWCGSFKIFTMRGDYLPHDQCPMAIALKESRVVRGVRALAERPDGTRVPFMPYPTLLKDEAGRVTGALNLLLDLTEGMTTESRLAAIVASSDDAIVSKDLDGIVNSWNAGAERIFGYSAAEMIGQSITRVIPPELQYQETEILARVRSGERIDHFETVRVTKDGRRLDVSLTVSPLRDQSGRVIGASKVARDITQQKKAERIQRLLMDELHHRVKNTLATVQAIGRQSLATAKSPAEFMNSFSQRIQALAKAHTLLTESGMRGASLGDLVEEQALISSGLGRRVGYSGPALQLDPQRTIHLGMILHELAANARQHGALSTSSGYVTITWEVRSGNGRTLMLNWQEEGGPPVNSNADTGFGTKLIDQTARGYGGKAQIDFRAKGLTCRIELPLGREEQPVTGGIKRVGGDTILLAKTQDQRSTVLTGKRVLVVEDEPLVAMDIRTALISAGCEVLGPAGTISEAKALIEDVNFDAALLDLNIEGASSEELAHTLARKNIPFAFVTGYRRMSLPETFRESLLLPKPFDREQLIAIAEALVYLSAPSGGVVRLRRGAKSTGTAA